MSFGAQTVGGAVISTFDIHVYTSVLTSDEVKILVAKYAIPLDLHPCVRPSGLTMNRLPVDKTGIYDQYLELSGVRVPFSTFLLGVIKHFRVHISQLVLLGLNLLTMFEIYRRSLEITPSINLFRAFYKFNKQGYWFSFERRSEKGGHDKISNEFCTSLKHWKDRFFLIDRRAIPDAIPWRHQISSVADPPLTGFWAEDICQLCENVIDLRLVHPSMLYEIGLTTIWKHVGRHLVFKDSEGTVATSMSQFLKFSLARGVRIGKGAAFAADEKVVEYENKRVLAAKRKAHAAKDKATEKRSAAEGTSRRTKKKKTDPLTFALDETEGDDSTRSGFGTHHSASPLNTIVLDDSTGGGGTLESVRHSEDDVKHRLDDEGNGTEVNSLHAAYSFEPQPSNHSDEDTHVHSGGGGFYHDEGADLTYRHAFGSFVLLPAIQAIRFFPTGTLVVMAPVRAFSFSLRADVAPPAPFVLAWNLTTHSILNDAESCRDMMINLATPAVQDQQSRLSNYQALQQGVKVGHSEEDAEAILADAIDYDPNCKDAFMSAFESHFTKSYPLIRSILRFEKCASLGLGAWTHPERVAFREICVTWSLALGLIRSVLHFGKCTSLGHWRLDSSGTCLCSGKYASLGHWRLDSSGV
ncbi:hypothetical protein Tco_0257731 [Tanacetum coccineum]